MKHYVRMIHFLLLLSLIFNLTACGSGGSGANNQLQTEQDQLADLLLVFSTRPDVTSQSDYAVLASATDEAAVVFRNYLGNTPAVTQFIQELPSALNSYRVEYALADSGESGVDAKAMAMHNLLGRLFSALETVGVQSHDFQVALLNAFASYEQIINGAEAEVVLSPESLELIDFFLISIYHQFLWRFAVSDYVESLEDVGTDPALIDTYNQNHAYVDSNLLAQLKNVETVLSYPDVLSDVPSLIQYQLNLYAINDLFLVSLAMRVSLFDLDLSYLSELAARMDSAGGVMTGMTVDRLLQSGEISIMYNSVYGEPASPPILLKMFAAADWVRPEMPLDYQLDPALADELISFGEPLPDEPDPSVFDDPYLALFRLDYDLGLSLTVARREMDQAEDVIYNTTGQLLSMSDRLVLFQTAESRIQGVLGRFTGATESEIRSLYTLLSYPVSCFIR